MSVSVQGLLGPVSEVHNVIPLGITKSNCSRMYILGISWKALTNNSKKNVPFFEATVNRGMSTISFSVCLLVVDIKATDLFKLILYPTILLFFKNHFYEFSGRVLGIFNVQYYIICKSA